MSQRTEMMWVAINRFLSLCVPVAIVFLVALRHHIERRLTLFAACAADAGRPIARQEFSARMKELPDLVGARIIRSSKRYDTLPMPTSTAPDAGE